MPGRAAATARSRRRHGPAGPAHRRARRRPERVIDLWRLDELRGIRIDGGALELGALTTYTDIRRSALCREHVPALVEAAATIGAAQIQNRGTIGGNVVNASPAGDTLPVLLAARRRARRRAVRAASATIPAAEFWPAYRRTALGAGRAAAAHPDPARGRPRACASARSARGGRRRSPRSCPWRAPGAGDPRLARRPDRARVRGRDADPGRGRPRPRSRAPPPTAETADRRPRPCAGELQPIDDVRSTAAYRLEVAGRDPPSASLGGRRVTEIGANRYGKDDDPPRQGRRGPRAPRGPRPDRRRRARGRLRGLLHRRRQRAGDRHRHDEEHGLRVRAGPPDRPIEAFGLALARHFLDAPQVERATVTIREHRWEPLDGPDGRPPTPSGASARRPGRHGRRGARRTTSSSPASRTSSS